MMKKKVAFGIAEMTYEVAVEELSIPNGENTIYSKIYKPDAEGQYPAIILCHGYNGTNNDFVTECKLYAENGYVAYAFDFCGGSVSSKSTGETSDMTLFTEKSDLIAVFNYIAELDAVDASQIVLFGGSQGGMVASLAAEELADRIIGLALYYPAFCIPDNWRDNYPDLDTVPDTFDFWGMTLGREFVVSIHDFYTFDEIGDLDKPVLILQGDQDNIAPLSYAEQAAELYENAELVVMEGEGHGFSATGAKTAREKVLDFLDSLTE